MNPEVSPGDSAATRVRAILLSILLFVCGGAMAGHAQNTIYSVAGGGSVSGPATGPNADLAAPSAVAKDSAGNMYIADASAHYVYKLDPSGNLTVFAGIGHPREHPINDHGLQATLAGLNSPSGVAVDSKDIVYIADTVNYMIRQVGLNGAINAIAGNAKLCHLPSTTNCGDGGVGMGAQLNYPIGVTTDAAGNVYIADTGDNEIRVVNTGTADITVAGIVIKKGLIETVAGIATGVPCPTPTEPCGDGGAATKAQLNNPQGVAVDSAGNIYIADSGDHRIRMVAATTGTISAYAGTGNPCNPNKGCGDNGAATSANLSNPFQISLDASGNLFVTDPPVNSIREITAGTQTISTVAGNGYSGFTGDNGVATLAKLNGSRGVTVDASGNVYIADTGNERIRMFPLGTNPIINTVAGGGSGNDASTATSAILGGGRGVALDSAGNLYIADTYNNRIREVTPSNPPTSYGTINTIVGSGIATSAELDFPSGVAVDSVNNVYIADTGNFVIRQYNPTSKVIATVAGKPQHACTAAPCGDNGPATSATFGQPTSVAVDSGGNVYIADASMHAIRVVNMGSATITVAGVSIQPGYIQTVAGALGTPCSDPLVVDNKCGDNGPPLSALLNTPFGVAVDSSGNIFIADTGDNRIRKVVVAATPKIIAYAFTGGTFFGPTNVPALHSQFNTPHYLAVDPHDNLYVSDSDVYNVIERIDAVNQHVVPVAGEPTDPKFYGLDGDGGLAFGAHVYPASLTVDGAGHLYIADSNNNRVREILLTPSAIPSVTALTFPAETVGTTSPAQSFQLSNQGSDDLYITTTAVNGPFALQSTTCSNNVVPPGAPCTFKLTFTPTAVGATSGSITVSDNAYGSPSQSVTLNGTGQ
jgi:trimeric autotransporter adhesin